MDLLVVDVEAEAEVEKITMMQGIFGLSYHMLGRIEEEDEDQLARQERQEERRQEERQKRLDEGGEEVERRRRVELGRPSTPEPIGLGMTYEDDEEPRQRSSPRPHSVIDQLFERLTMLSSQLEPAIELSSALQAQYAAAQNTLSALESKATALEELVQAQSPVPSPPPPEPTPAPQQPDSVRQVPN